MFVLVSLRQRGDDGFQLPEVAPAIIHQRRRRDARHGEERIDIISDSLDLFELSLEAQAIGFGSS